jgi:glycogen operon protein
MLEFTRRLISLRQQHPIFRRRDFFGGPHDGAYGLPDIRWFRTDGRDMTRRDWRAEDLNSLGVFLNGEAIPTVTDRGQPIVDDSFVMLVNGGHEPVSFRLPARRFGNRWRFVLSTAEPDLPDGAESYPARAEAPVPSRSILLLRRAW